MQNVKSIKINFYWSYLTYTRPGQFVFASEVHILSIRTLHSTYYTIYLEPDKAISITSDIGQGLRQYIYILSDRELAATMININYHITYETQKYYPSCSCTVFHIFTLAADVYWTKFLNSAMRCTGDHLTMQNVYGRSELRSNQGWMYFLYTVLYS